MGYEKSDTTPIKMPPVVIIPSIPFYTSPETLKNLKISYLISFIIIIITLKIILEMV
jgi:hypothetical protein